MDALLDLCPGRVPPVKYNDFLRLLEAAGPPPPPLPPIERMPAELTRVGVGQMSAGDLLSTSVPKTLLEIGFRGTLPTAPEWHCSGAARLLGGETTAVERVAAVVKARAS